MGTSIEGGGGGSGSGPSIRAMSPVIRIFSILRVEVQVWAARQAPLDLEAWVPTAFLLAMAELSPVIPPLVELGESRRTTVLAMRSQELPCRRGTWVKRPFAAVRVELREHLSVLVAR